MNQENNIMNMLPDNYQRVVNKELTDSDVKNIMGLKAAHDAVYEFFERISHDHRRMDVSEEFKAEIAKTQEAIRAHMDMMSSDDMMINFFFLCSLRCIREGEVTEGRHFPVNLEELEVTLINPQELSDALAPFTDRQVALQAGIFVGEDDEIDHMLTLTIDSARAGAMVMSDDAFILTDGLDDLAIITGTEEWDALTEREKATLWLGKVKELYDFSHLDEVPEGNEGQIL